MRACGIIQVLLASMLTISCEPAEREDSALTESDAPKVTWDPESPQLTPAEQESFQPRAAYFEDIRPEFRPDLDWREALSEPFASRDPQWSQGFEELVIRDFFQDREGGFFLDVGCYLPRDMSTTYYLEDQLGWTGIGVDAIGSYGKAWKKHRPNSTFMHRAVSDVDGETVTLHVAGPIASVQKGVVDQFSKDSVEIEVPTITLNTLLEQHGIGKVDFLSMDIEGAEPAALRGFDIRRYKPDLCCIEFLEKDFVMDYFTSNGYELLTKYQKIDKHNLYFAPVDR